MSGARRSTSPSLLPESEIYSPFTSRFSLRRMSLSRTTSPTTGGRPLRRTPTRTSSKSAPYTIGSPKNARLINIKKEDWASLSPEPRASLSPEPRASLNSRPQIFHPTINSESAPSFIPTISSNFSGPVDDKSFIFQAERALEVARASQQALEMEERLVLSWLREKELATRYLQQDVEAIRTRWQAVSHQVGAIRVALLARGVTPSEAPPPPLDQGAIMRQHINSAFQDAEQDRESLSDMSASIFPSLTALKGPIPLHIAKPAEVPVRDMASPLQASPSSTRSSSPV